MSVSEKGYFSFFGGGGYFPLFVSFCFCFVCLFLLFARLGCMLKLACLLQSFNKLSISSPRDTLFKQLLCTGKKSTDLPQSVANKDRRLWQSYKCVQELNDNKKIKKKRKKGNDDDDDTEASGGANVKMKFKRRKWCDGHEMKNDFYSSLSKTDEWCVCTCVWASVHQGSPTRMVYLDNGV